MLDRLGQCQGGLILQRRKLGTELAIETKERSGFFGIQRLGEHVAIAWIGAGAELALHHKQVELVTTGLEVHRLGPGTLLAEEFSEIEAPRGAGKIERTGKFRGRPATGPE